MAATGSNPKERHLAQPPRGFRGAVPGRRGLHFPHWVVAVLLSAALIVVVLPAARGSAGTAPSSTTTATVVATPTQVVSAATVVDPTAPVVPILFPLEQRVPWTDTFGAARSGGRTHAGNDLLAPKMTPLLAVVGGEIDWLNLTGKLSTYNNLPYYNILLRGDDGNDYFYIHLNNDTPGTDDGLGGIQYAYAPGITGGTRVKQGDVIGYVGDSGNAEDTVSHLHFEIHLGGYVAAGTGMTRPPSAIDPYASLKAAPTLGEWVAAGKPPVSTMIPPGSTTTSNPTTTTTTVKTTTSTKPPTTTTTTGVGGSGFRDVHTADWFYADLSQAQAAGIVTSATDDFFHPYATVSRALFAAYLVRTMAPAELQRSIAAAATATVAQPTFKDVPVTYWAYNEIQTAARLGLVKGTGSGAAYSPEVPVTRAQMATMICRALGADLDDDWAGDVTAADVPFEDVPQGYWAQGAVVMVDYLGLMRGDANDCFRPAENTTRAQAITVMARLLRLLEGGSGS